MLVPVSVRAGSWCGQHKKITSKAADEGPHLSSVIQKTKGLGSCPSPAIS